MRLKQFLLPFIPATAALLGGCGDRLSQAAREYVPPVKVTQYGRFTPAKDSKAAGMLKSGETSIDLDEVYRGCHRLGWDAAFANWRSERKFLAKELLHVADPQPAGDDGYWDGYVAAMERIKQVEQDGHAN